MTSKSNHEGKQQKELILQKKHAVKWHWNGKGRRVELLDIDYYWYLCTLIMYVPMISRVVRRCFFGTYVHTTYVYTNDR